MSLLVETLAARDVILCRACPAGPGLRPDTKVIVIGHLNDVMLYRELIRQGVSEYLVAPVHQLQIIETIANLFQIPRPSRSAASSPLSAPRAASVRARSPTISAGIMSRQLRTDTVITDLDLAFGTAGLNFNQDSSQGIVDALGQPDRVDQTLIDRLLTKCGDKLSLLASPGAIDRDFISRHMRSRPSSSTVRHSVPCVVVDVPNMWAPWIKYTLVQADDVVITATPELASLRNAKNLDRPAQAGAAERPAAAAHPQPGRRPQAPGNSGRRIRQGPRHRAGLIDPLRRRRPSAPRQQRPDAGRGHRQIEGGRSRAALAQSLVGQDKAGEAGQVLAALQVLSC